MTCGRRQVPCIGAATRTQCTVHCVLHKGWAGRPHGLFPCSLGKGIASGRPLHFCHKQDDG